MLFGELRNFAVKGRREIVRNGVRRNSYSPSRFAFLLKWQQRKRSGAQAPESDFLILKPGTTSDCLCQTWAVTYFICASAPSSATWGLYWYLLIRMRKRVSCFVQSIWNCSWHMVSTQRTGGCVKMEVRVMWWTTHISAPLRGTMKSLLTRKPIHMVVIPTLEVVDLEMSWEHPSDDWERWGWLARTDYSVDLLSVEDIRYFFWWGGSRNQVLLEGQ